VKHRCNDGDVQLRRAFVAAAAAQSANPELSHAGQNRRRAVRRENGASERWNIDIRYGINLPTFAAHDGFFLKTPYLEKHATKRSVRGTGLVHASRFT